MIRPEQPPAALIDEAIARALAEDLGRAGDITTEATVDAGSRSSARIVARRPGTISGLPIARRVFARLDADVRFEAGAADGDPACVLAREVYCHRIRKYVGAYLAVLGGADAVAFTGGVGENATSLRADVVTPLAGLGLHLDAERNEAERGDVRTISTDDSPVAVLVVPTDEERAIAQATRDLIGRTPG